MADLKAFRGDTNIYNLSVVRQNAPVNLSSVRMWFTAKLNRDVPDAQADIHINSVDNATQVFYPFPLQGKAQVILHPGDTADLTESALYYDIQMIESSGVVTTIASGVLHIEDDVTLATA